MPFIAIPDSNLMVAHNLLTAQDLWDNINMGHDVICDLMEMEWSPDLFGAEEIHAVNKMMWENHEGALCLHVIHCVERLLSTSQPPNVVTVLDGIARSVDASLKASVHNDVGPSGPWPAWVSQPEVIESHRAYLLWKNSDFYSGFWPNTQPMPMPFVRVHGVQPTE